MATMTSASSVLERTTASAPEWQAIVERNPRFDGLVYYGVLSTGIYCRPSCPSRKPRPGNVRLFFARRDAEEAGFRACLRCRPASNVQTYPKVETVRRVCRHIEQNLDNSLTLRELAAVVGLDATHLQKLFKETTGISPKQYIDARRLSVFKTELRGNGRNVTGATYEVGYGSSSRVYERAGAQLGMTPATYRKGAPGVSIRYATANSSLGHVLLAATQRGICSITIGDSDRILIAELFREFSKATFEPDQDALGAWLRRVVAEIEGSGRPVALPLDIQATAFQRRVFEALRRIPSGETRSYSQIAAELGDVKAQRAVAQACAHNPVAVVIPCHRVVGKNGDTGGYRWGVERKKKLLANERPRA